MRQTRRISVTEFSAHKGISVHVTGETSPKRSRKWPKKRKKGQQKLGKLLKKGQQDFKVTKKGQQNIFLKQMQ